jgi:putative acetyltransferase
MQAVTPLLIRTTEMADRDAVVELVRAAFSGPDRDGSEEVGIVRHIWDQGDLARPIDLVAADGETIVGHVLGSRGTVGEVALLGLAPLAVLPDRQRRGVGSALVHELLQRAESAGWPAVVLLGDPAYYSRFGFEPSGPQGITYAPVGADSPYFQVHVLASHDRSLRGEYLYCWEQP